MKTLNTLLLFLLANLALAQDSQIKFIQNLGQLSNTNGDPVNDVLFYGDANGVQYFIRKTGISYIVYDAELNYKNFQEDKQNKKKLLEKGITTPVLPESKKSLQQHGFRVDLNWLDCNTAPIAEPSEPYNHKLNYYSPRFPNGLTGVLSYKKILLKNIYPNIDVLIYSKKSQIKYDYIVHKGGNLENIQFNFNGTQKIVLTNDTIAIQTPYATLKDFIPESYIVQNKNVLPVNMHFSQNSNGAFSINAARELDNFDKLVIDPGMWVTYLGGTNMEIAYDLEGDLNKNMYVTGYCASNDFPITVGAFQTSFTGSTSAFLSKFSPGGSLLWSTFYAGSTGFFEIGYGVCCDLSNNVYMCGTTYSADFPVTVGAYQPTIAGSSDGFIVKFDDAGIRLWATFFGGTNNETLYKIDKDNSNNIWITGYTSSTDLPTLLAYQPTSGGSNDVILSSFSPAGALLYSTYLGGTGSDVGNDIDFTPGFIGIVGVAEAGFPLTTGVFDSTITVGGAGFATDAFYSKFDLSGSLIYSTFLGGSAYESATSIQFDGTGAAIVAGNTGSFNYPTTAGAYSTVFGSGGYDCFMAKFKADNTVLWSTYYGNSYWEYGADVTLDAANNIYLFSEWEDDAFVSLPVLGCAYQKVFGGVEDQFIVKFSPNCENLCLTYLGGPMEDDNEGAGGIEFSDGFLYAACYTVGGFPVTAGCYQPSFAGSYDVVLAKLCSIGCGDTASTKAIFAVDDTICVGFPSLFHASSISCDTTLVHYEWSFPGGSPSSSNFQNAITTYNSPGTYSVTLKASSPCDTATKTLSFVVLGAGSLSVDVNIDKDTICPGDTVHISSVVTGASAPYAYQWSTGIQDTLSTVTVSLTSSGYISLAVANSSCFVGMDSVYVHLAIPTLVAPEDTCICNGNSITLTATGSPGYLWNTGATTQSITVSPSVTTTYVVSYSGEGCFTSDTTVVCVNPAPTANIIAQDSICIGTTVTFTASVTGGITPYSYDWSGIVSDTTVSVSSTPSASGTETLIVTTPNGCNDTVNTSLTVLSIPNIVSSPDTCICPGETITIQATGTPSFSWNTGQTSASINVSPANTFSYIVSYSNGICGDSDTTIVCVHPGVSVTASNDTTMEFNHPVELAAVGTGPFNWSPSTGLSCVDCTNPEANPEQTITYTVSTTNAYGCTASDEVTITVYYVVIVPNIITPNQDGINDTFKILGLPNNVELSIFNRWGNLLHSTTSYNNDWSTTTEGVYYYLLSLPDGNNLHGFFHVNHN